MSRGYWYKSNIRRFVEQKSVNKCSYLIICGVITADVWRMDICKKLLKIWTKSVPAIFIAIFSNDVGGIFWMEGIVLENASSSWEVGHSEVIELIAKQPQRLFTGSCFLHLWRSYWSVLAVQLYCCLDEMVFLFGICILLVSLRSVPNKFKKQNVR